MDIFSIIIAIVLVVIGLTLLGSWVKNKVQRGQIEARIRGGVITFKQRRKIHDTSLDFDIFEDGVIYTLGEIYERLNG